MGRVVFRRAVSWIALTAILGVLCSGLIAEAHREAADPGDSDAIAFASGARLALSDPQHLYDRAAQARAEDALLHIPLHTHFVDPFTNIAAGALLLSPLAHVGLWTASEIEVVVCVTLLAVALLMALRLFSPQVPGPLKVLIAGAALLSVPAASAVIQWDSLMAVALIGSVFLARRQHYEWAGIVLATLVLKPQVMWLVFPALVAARSWRYLSGLLIGVAGWVLVSLVVAGPHGVMALAQLIAQSYPAQADNSVGLPSLVSAFTGSGVWGFVAAAALGLSATAFLLWRAPMLRDRPVQAVALGVALSLLCSPHVNAEDLMLLVLPIVLIAGQLPSLALGEALALSIAEVGQMHLPTGLQHFEPFVLLAINISLMLAYRVREDSATEGRARRPALRAAPG